MASKKVCKPCYYYYCQVDPHRVEQLFYHESGCFDPPNHSSLQPKPEVVVIRKGYGQIEPLRCSDKSCTGIRRQWCPFHHDQDELIYAAVPLRTSQPTIITLAPGPRGAQLNDHPLQQPDPGGGTPDIWFQGIPSPPQPQIFHQVIRPIPHVQSQVRPHFQPPKQSPSQWPNLDAISTRRSHTQSQRKPVTSRSEPSASSEDFHERRKVDLDAIKEIIKQPLTRENYKEKMNNLICCEEGVHISKLGEKCNGDYKLVVYEKGSEPSIIASKSQSYSHLGCLEGIKPYQVAYATQASEAVYIVKMVDDRKIEVSLNILYENNYSADDRMYIGFQEDDYGILCDNFPELQQKNQVDKVIVEFEVNHRYFNNLIKAVNGVSSAVINKLMPLEEDFPRFVSNENFQNVLDKYVRDQLDPEGQIDAIKSIISCRADHPILLLKGSFGTGKTRVLALAAYYFTKLTSQTAHVLICAHHQHSADHLINNYFGPMCVEGALNQKVIIVRLDNRKKNYKPKYSEDVYYFSFNEFCEFASMPNNNLRNSNIIVATTFLTSLCFRYSQLFPRGFFTHILIDEGGQAREPETLAPLCLATKDTKIVIAGDPCQVGPALLVLGDEERENGLKLSLLDRLRMSYQKCGQNTNRFVITLLNNYRCQKPILDIPNKLFYRSQLKTCVKSTNIPYYPVFFICSSLSLEQPTPEFEARVLLEQVLFWLNRKKNKLQIKDISIVTANRAQLVVTQNVARENYSANLSHIPYGQMLTSHTIQGKEFQAVFWSTREPPFTTDGGSWDQLKSPCDRYVFNTVLTRAKSLVVVVGSPLVLLRSEKNMVELYRDQGKCWSLYMLTCLRKNTLIIPDMVESNPVVRDEFKDRLKRMVENIWSEQQPSPKMPPDPPVASPHLETTGQTPSPVSDVRKHRSMTTQPSKQGSDLSSHSRGAKVIAALPQCSQKRKTAASIASKRKTHSDVMVKERQQPEQRTAFSSIVGSPVDDPQARKQETKHGLTASTNQQKLNNNKSPKSGGAMQSKNFSAHSLLPYTLTSGNSSGKKKKKGKKSDATVPVFSMTSFPPLGQQETIPDPPAAHSPFYEQYKDQLNQEVLTKGLEPLNYKTRFHHLLCWEEKTHDDILKERSGNFKVVIYEPPKEEVRSKQGLFMMTRFGYLSCEDGDTLSYAKQAGEGCFILFNGEFVHAKYARDHYNKPPGKANYNAITFRLNDYEARKLLRLQPQAKTACNFPLLRVVFELKHSYFTGLHHAVNRLPHQIIYKILPNEGTFVPFPSKKDPSYVWYEDLEEVDCTKYKDMLNLDKEQTHALHVIMNSSSHIPVLVAGPFGTGKTRLLARAAYEILKDPNSRVLVCAHHQASVDTFITSYFGKMKSWDVKFIRVIPYEIENYRIDNHHLKQFYRYKGDYTTDELMMTRLVVTTLGTAHSLPLSKDKKLGFFTHILIDEGAQTREPETLGPLCFAGKFTKIVIAGDHCQVGPRTLVLGEVPRKHGLADSLLERLHDAYEQLGDKGRYRSLTLLNNYRCHSGILMLSSSLFYKSSLQCKFNPHLAHPFVKYPLQFVCSSLDRNDRSYLEDTNKKEAECLVREVKRYLNNWSVEHSKVCIISPSANQCSLIRDTLKQKSNKDISNVEIRKAFDIQGHEFRAIFVGTAEVLDAKTGESKNTTKAISDPYIFNTVITRSQSLVVAVGNPFLLLKSEEHMVKKFGREKARCWSQYIKRCIERDTFHRPHNVECEDTYDNIECLNRMLSNKQHSVIQSDTILDKYRKVFESTSKQTKMKLTICRMEKKHMRWQITKVEGVQQSDESNSDEKEKVIYVERYECVLEIVNSHEAIAIPTDEHKKIVNIENRRNRIGAFDGDTVSVGVFDDERKECYGRVLKVIERGSLEQNFVCRVSSHDPLVFYPVDKKNPTFINLPRLSERHARGSKDKAVEVESEDDIIVFDTQSTIDIQNQHLPKIRDVIPLSEAKNMLFIVSYVQWNPKYRSPLGMVIDILPKGTSAFKAERLLKFKHNVEYNDDGKEFSASDVTRDPNVPLFDSCIFTIDPEDAQNLDDALSLKLLHSEEISDPPMYELGVHIVNVAKHIAPGSEEDKFARHVGTSVYGGCKGKIMHMLPAETRQKLSLIPNCVRDVISVVTHVSIDGDLIQIYKPKVKIAQIKSVVQLSYKNAQEIMDNKEVSTATNPEDGIVNFNFDREQPSLSETLRLLYKIAFCRRKERLKEAGTAAYCYDVNEAEEAHCWQTHLLVEELMIWANSNIAERVHKQFRDCALLRRQRSPNQESMKSFFSKNQNVLTHSLYLSSLMSSDMNCIKTSKLLIPRSTLIKLHEAVSNKDAVLLSSLITSDRSYPQLATAYSQLKSNFQRAEYCCTEAGKHRSEYHHYSLCLDDYTHFTSPMRRYIDIVVQRMVLELDEVLVPNRPLRDAIDFSKNNHQDLCHSLNNKSRNAGQFEKSITNVRLAVKLSSNSEVYDSFIYENDEGTIKLFFPNLELNNLPQKDKRIKLTHIVPPSKDSSDNDSKDYQWSVKMTSMNEKQGIHILSRSCLKLEKRRNDSEEAGIHFEVLHSDSGNNDSSLKKEHYCAHQSHHPISVCEVSPELWKKALDFVRNPTDAKLEEFTRVLPKIPPAGTKTEDCPSHLTSPFLNYKLRLSLKENASLKVWMTWKMHEAHISPAIQMVELTPGLRICVQHNAHPAECFSDQNLSKTFRKPYPSKIEDYVKLWEKLVLAEAAESSVKDFQPVIIQDTQLVWPKLTVPSNCIDEVYYTTEEQSVIMKLPQHFIDNCSVFFKINVGDLVCARYGTDPHACTRAVFHMVVHKLECKDDDDDEGKVESVYLKFIGESNCKISQRMKDDLLNKPCEVQIISLTKSYQRVYQGLVRLIPNKAHLQRRRTVSELVTQVALTKIDPKNCEVSGQFTEVAKAVMDGDWKSNTLWGREQKQLNCGQIDSMKLTLERKFQLIQGPPGTGKSETGAHIAYTFAIANRGNKKTAQHCVLYCGPSNKSVDVVLAKLDGLRQHHPNVNLKILRIYGRSVERKKFKGPLADEVVADYAVDSSLAEKYALHVLLRKSKLGSGIKEIEEKINNLQAKGEIADGKMCLEYREILLSAEKKFLKEFHPDIVLCTCNETASNRMTYLSPRQCIIDECGMATEPESIAPISLCEHVVLIGDHKQLQPVIDYIPAKDSGLAISLFERYAKIFEAKKPDGAIKPVKPLITRLTTQYRMHKAICEFPSQYFYDGTLETDKSVIARDNRETKLNGFWPQGAECPIVFCNIVGEEGQSATGKQGKRKVGKGSKFNRQEAEKVVQIVQVLHHVHKVKLDQIAVLTPYSAQKDLIEEKMPDDLKSVKVASITESQGDEYGIVILSTVRSQPKAEIKNRHHIQPDNGWLRENLGFITDKHQINVGITRSKYGLVIVGNKRLLKYDDTWKELIKHYKDKKCLVKDEEKFPTSEDPTKLKSPDHQLSPPITT